MKGVKPTDIALFRWVDYAWNELYTEHIATKPDSEMFRAVSSGFSYFAIAKKEAEEIVEEVKIEPKEEDNDTEKVTGDTTRDTTKPKQDIEPVKTIFGIFKVSLTLCRPTVLFWV